MTDCQNVETHFSSRAIEHLKTRDWPGNVRELRNAIEHAVLLARGGAIEPEHFPAAAGQAPVVPADGIVDEVRKLLRRWAEIELQGDGPADLHRRLLEVVEPPVLRVALDHYGGQYAAAARALGIHRTTLKRRLQD